MKTEPEIQAKIKEIEEALKGVDEELEEALEDEDTDEFSDKGAEIEAQFEAKKDIIQEEIDLLKWVLE
ncbi:MAG: hypothetical protein HQ530_00265 [Parcubacteria group bacterium]|nr:hypothetical protein [Parcubacteria group bacterium]